MSQTDTKPNNTPATVEKPLSPTQAVAKRIQGYLTSGTIHLPKDYSVENALKEAWYAIMSSDQKDAILACSRESQEYALHDMVVQGMSVSKKQGYFIPYGKTLKFQRSYFGDIVLAQRVRPGIEPYFDVVYEGEEILPEKVRTRHGFVTTIKGHKMIRPRTGKIVEAYVGIVDENGEEMGAEVMTIEQIKKSWQKSKIYKGDASQTFHNEQPDRACLRTVIRRRCTPIINTSTDKALMEAINRQDDDAILAEANDEAETNGNGELLSLTQGQPVTEPVATGEGETVTDEFAEKPAGEGLPF